MSNKNNEPTCPHCHQEENTKEVCCRCGYEYTDEDYESEESGTYFFVKAILFIAVFFAIIFLSAIIDNFALNARYYNKIVYGSDCNYVVPAGFKIVYNDEKNKYAVADLSYGDYYLYNNQFEIMGMFSSIAEPSLFQDSCGAKAYLKAYLISKQPTMSNFK